MEQRETARLFSSFRDVPISISESDSFKLPFSPWGPVDLVAGIIGVVWTVFWTLANLDSDPLVKFFLGVFLTASGVYSARLIKKGRPPLVSRVVWMIRRWFPPVIDVPTHVYRLD